MDKSVTESKNVTIARPAFPCRKFESDFTLPDFFTDKNLAALGAVTSHHLATNFLDPVREYMGRPRKNFRASLVEVGALLAAEDSLADNHGGLALIKDAVECLHAGSLIVDDVQDNSLERRGSPSFHMEHGVASAICTGNWMYFWPLKLLGRIEWSPERKLKAFELFNRALELAHYGQYLDLTVKAEEMDGHHLAELGIKTAELKTGTITALAFELGALLTGSLSGQCETLSAISNFGKNFGIALQRLDDWGNACSKMAGSKRFEDLTSGKPTTIWHDIICFGTDSDLATFSRAVSQLPNFEPVATWIRTSEIPARAFADIQEKLHAAVDVLADQLTAGQSGRGIAHLRKIIEELLLAYK